MFALGVRLPAFRAPAELSYDDGVYQAAAISMRTGALPFRQVFSAQGPLFYPAVWFADLLGFRTDHAPRIAAVAAGIAITICAAWLAGRKSAAAFWVVGILVATSGTILRTTSALTSDGIAFAWALMALCLAVSMSSSTQNSERTREPNAHTSVRQVLMLGILVGAAIGTKNLLVAPTVLITAYVIFRRFGARIVVAFGSVAVAFVLVWMVIWDFRKAYQQSIQYHLEKSTSQTLGFRWNKLVRVIAERDVPILIVCGISIGIFLWLRIWRARRTYSSAGVAALGTEIITPALSVSWILMSGAVLLGENAMFANHVSFVALPLALLFAPSQETLGIVTERLPISSRRGTALLSTTLIVVAAIVSTTVLVVRSSDFMSPPHLSADQRAVQDAISSLPPAALGLSDEPGVLVLAGMTVPPFFVDGSRMRLDSDVDGIRLTSALILKEARNERVCLVVVWSDTIWGSLKDLGPKLMADGYSSEPLRHGRVMYRKSSDFCDGHTP